MGSSHKELDEKKRSPQISASEANGSSNVSSSPQVIEEQESVKKIINKNKRKKWKLKRKSRSEVLQKNSNDKDGNEEVPKVAVEKNRKKREREDFVDEELLERRRIKREKRLKRNEMREKAKIEGEKKSTEMIEKAKKHKEEGKSNETGEKSKKREKEKKSNEVVNEPVDFEKKAEEEAKVNQSENKKVYVGGIPYYSSEDDIRSFFESCGTITEMDCMTFPETGKFRGIAFLTFKTEAAAKRALALDGADMGGFFLKIQPYKAKQQTSKPEFTPEAIEGYNRAYVGNLSWDITEDDLKSFFTDCKISTVRFGMDKETGEFKGYAHVDFEDPVSLSMALKLDQHVVCGRPARISRAVPPKKVAGPVGQPNKANESSDGLEKMKRPEPKKKEDVITGSKKKRRTCYECGVPGHLSSACPKKKAAVVAAAMEG